MAAQVAQTITQYPPNPKYFPMGAFPPVMAGAIYDVWHRTKAPVPLIASSVLSASALACQRRYQVKLPFGATSPLALFLLLFANSGERKSAADNLVYGAINKIEKERREEYQEQCKISDKKVASWRALEKRIQRQILRVDGKRLAELQAALEEHHAVKPVEPVERRYILDDVTPAAIVDALRKFPSASLVSNDGRTMLMGRALSDPSLINRAWERAVLRVNRKNAPAIMLDDYDLSLWVMAQPGVLEELMHSDRGQVSRSTGLLARCLPVMPDSTQGQRPFDPVAFQPEEGIQGFHQRLETELRAATERTTIEMDPGAIDMWTDFHNYVEHNLAPGGYLSDLKDFASKAAENLARIAAIFHVMSGRSGPLRMDHVQHAGDLMLWYLEEAKRLFGAPPMVDQAQSDAMALAAWCQCRIVRPNWSVDLAKETIYNYGPNALRERARLDPALTVLRSMAKVMDIKVGQKSLIRYLGYLPLF